MGDYEILGRLILKKSGRLLKNLAGQEFSKLSTHEFIIKCLKIIFQKDYFSFIVAYVETILILRFCIKPELKYEQRKH